MYDVVNQQHNDHFKTVHLNNTITGEINISETIISKPTRLYKKKKEKTKQNHAPQKPDSETSEHPRIPYHFQSPHTQLASLKMLVQ